MEHEPKVSQMVVHEHKTAGDEDPYRGIEDGEFDCLVGRNFLYCDRPVNHAIRRRIFIR